MTTDQELAERLRRLEGAEWATAGSTMSRRRPRVGVAAFAAGLVLLGGLGGAIVAGVTRSESDVRSLPGVFNEGQPLHCSGLDEMTLAEADQYVSGLGYTVFWQIERGDATTIADAPPPAGTIAGGVVTSDSTILLVVDPTGTERNAAPRC